MQYLTPSEKEKLLRAVYSETGKHRKRNIAIFEVGLYCALRVSEIKGLKVACYDWDRKTLFCYRLKGSHANTIKIVDLHVVKALEDYLKERTERVIDSPYLFISQKGNPISCLLYTSPLWPQLIWMRQSLHTLRYARLALLLDLPPIRIPDPRSSPQPQQHCRYLLHL